MLCRKLTDGKGIEHLDIIRHSAGLRPVREGGTRIEKECMGRSGWFITTVLVEQITNRPMDVLKLLFN